MKRLPIGIILAALFFATPCSLVFADENAQQLAEKEGVGIKSGDDEESAAELAKEQGVSIAPGDNEQSADSLAAQDGMNMDAADQEESAEDLAKEQGNAIAPGDNEQSARDLAEKEGLEEKPKIVKSGSTGSAYAMGGGVNGTIYALAAQADGKVVIGGNFNNVAGQPRSNIARLNADGTLDASFLADLEDGVNGTVYALAIDSKGNILAGGYFEQPKNSELKNLIQYTKDGKINTNFNNGQTPNGPVYAIAIQPDGQIVIGGEFSQIGSTELRNVARFAANSKLESSNSFNPSGTIRALAVLPDGAVTAGGIFEVAGSPARNIMTLPPSSR